MASSMRLLLSSCCAAAAFAAAADGVVEPLGLPVQPAVDGIRADGAISDHEWGHAALMLVDDRVSLLAKASVSHLYLAWHSDPRQPALDLDLFIADADGAIRHLHVSSVLAERDPQQAGSNLAGSRSRDWVANTVRPLAGMPPDGSIRDGIEFALERRQLREPLRFRFELRDPTGSEAPRRFPAAADAHDPSRWLPLALPPLGDGRVFAADR